MGLKLPPIVDDSISILSDGGLGMALFSIGTTGYAEWHNLRSIEY